MKPRATAVARSLVVLGVAYFVLWACAPATRMPPPVPFDRAGGHEVGLAGSAGITTGTAALTGDGLFWYHGRVHELISVGAVAFGGGGSGAPRVGGGGFARFRFFQHPRVFFGLQVAGGFAWGSGGLPLAVRVGPSTWVYTHPSVGLRSYGLLAAPLGVSVAVGRMRVHAEAEVQGLGVVGEFFDPPPDEPHIRLSLGLSHRW